MGDPSEALDRPIPHRTVICIGDVHGYFTKLHNLWTNLETLIGPIPFSRAVVIFLGDYCDRGPDTRRVIDFLSSLPSAYPDQSHVFLCGNHDFAFAAFVSALPPPPPPSPSSFAATWAEYEANSEREGWFSGEGHEGMHVQGRRWGGSMGGRWNPKKGMAYKGSIYDAGPTFESYGVPHGSPVYAVFEMLEIYQNMENAVFVKNRLDQHSVFTLQNLSKYLVKAMPETHKKFLSDLVWVHEEEDVWIDSAAGMQCCRLIAVHAGLDKSKGVEEQLRILRARDTSLPKVGALSGRTNVWGIPKELQSSEKPTILVSGHHGKLHIDGLRLIIDEGGGMEDLPVAAIILPSMKIVRDIDNFGADS